MKDHAVVTIVAENCHQITRCSCSQTGIRQKLKSLVQKPLPHGRRCLGKRFEMHRASKRGSYLAGFPLAFLSERNFRIASLGQTQLEVRRCHTYLTSQCLSHATHPWKAVKAGHAQHFPSLSSLGSESQIWHLGNPAQTVGVNWIGEVPQTTAHTDLPITTFAIITWNNPNFQLCDTNASYKAMAANGLSGWPRWPRLNVRLSLPVVLHEAQVEAAGFNCFCLTSADRNKHASCIMQHAAYPAYDVMLLRDSPKMSKVVTACLSSLPGALPSITAARFNLDFSVPQRCVQIKDQASDIPWQDVSKNCLDMFIAESSGTRHLQALTARSGTSLIPNSKSGKGNSRGKHTDHHTDHRTWQTPWSSHWVCMLAAAASADAFARSHFWRLCGPKKIKHLTFHDKTFQRIAWTCSLLRAVELGICKDSRQGLGLLWSLTRKVEEETHVANTLIITLIIALGKHTDHHTEFACLLQLPFWFWGPARRLVSARCMSCCFCMTFCYFSSSPVCLNEMT